jgi:uncharacterized protein
MQWHREILIHIFSVYASAISLLTNAFNMSQQLSAASLAAPVNQSDRITILDSLRGFAILGILLMNIPSFGLTGDTFVLHETGINYRTWYFVNLVPDGTQRAMFSMLFGAGIILFVQNVERRVEGIRVADYFFRRQLWLAFFSLVDVFLLLWNGDILFDYALFGMLVFTFRNLPAKKLLIAAGVCLLLMLARENRDLYKDKKIITRGEAIAALDTTTVKLTPKQQEQLGAMQDYKQRSSIEKRSERIKKNFEKISKGSYEEVYEIRTERYISQMVRYIFFEAWDVLLFMFLGMAFFKMGILTGQASIKIYWWMLIVGLGLGLLLSYLHLQPAITYQYNNYEYTKHVLFEYYQLQRALRSVGLLAALILLYRSGVFKWLFAIMRPVGQMAFTNYLVQSLICGLFFNSMGLGMYGKLQRIEIYYVVLAVWIFQIIFCNIWLRFFRFGPFEWAWRSLTYWKMQPIKKPVL